MDRILCVILITAIIIMSIIIIYMVRILDTTDVKKIGKTFMGIVFLCYGIYICSDVVSVLMVNDINYLKEEFSYGKFNASIRNI